MSETKSHITGFVLKVVAILGMTTNHIAHAYSNYMPVWLTIVLYSFGGLTYPIMAFLIVQGYKYTSNIKKYATRLAIFAVISQVPFTLLFGWEANVLFTLLIGLGLLWVYDNVKQLPLKILLFAVGTIISYWCDWAVQGPLIVFLFYYFRDKGRAGVALTMLLPYAVTLGMVAMEIPEAISTGLDMGASAMATGTVTSWPLFDIAGLPIVLHGGILIGLCNLGYALVGFTLAMLLIMFYNGQRGRPMKWFFYVYYPLHLFVIWGIQWLFF